MPNSEKKRLLDTRLCQRKGNFRQTGNRLRQTGNHFRQTGNRLRQTGNSLRQTGNRLALASVKNGKSCPSVAFPYKRSSPANGSRLRLKAAYKKKD